MNPGIIPIFACPGVITPGQFGPTRRVFLFSRAWFTLTISDAGMPSVIHIIKSKFALIDSIIAPAANFGGTKITDVFAFCFSTAS